MHNVVRHDRVKVILSEVRLYTILSLKWTNPFSCAMHGVCPTWTNNVFVEQTITLERMMAKLEKLNLINFISVELSTKLTLNE